MNKGKKAAFTAEESHDGDEDDDNAILEEREDQELCRILLIPPLLIDFDHEIDRGSLLVIFVGRRMFPNIRCHVIHGSWRIVCRHRTSSS